MFDIKVSMELRDGSREEYVLSGGLHWRKERYLRWTQKYKRLLGQALHITLTQHNNFDATEVVVSIANGFRNKGTKYFTNLKIEVDGEVREYSGKHMIRPRGIIAERFVTGPDADQVRDYKHIPEEWVPEWLPHKAKVAIDKYHNRSEDSYGPYKPFWNKFHTLSDSHGGAGIAPFSDWTKCKEGYQLRSLEFYGEVCRSPIACLKPRNGKPLQLNEKYWLGRTYQHELPQFNSWPDNWCEYSEWLMHYQAHDYTHLWRMIRAAWQLAPYDPFARMFMKWVWNDCKMNLEGAAGNNDYNNLFWSLTKRMRSAEPNQGARWADRGFYHVIRCFLSVSPYIGRRERKKWRRLFIAAIRRVVTPDGVCLRDENVPQHIFEVMGDVPLTRGFQAQLLASVYEELGLDDILANFRNTFPIWVPDYSETLNHSNHNGHEMYRPYNGMYNIGIFGYDSFEHFNAANESRGVNGASQDYDCTNPKSYLTD
jgi:hypothetical protein